MSAPESTAELHHSHGGAHHSHTWHTVGNSAAYLLPHLEGLKSIKVLDVGCGSGSLTCELAARLPEAEITGIDRAEGDLEIARSQASKAGRTNITFMSGDALSLPFPDDTFDLAHAHQALHHMKDPVQALREMRRVTKNGGLVAARDMDVQGFFWYPEDPRLAEWASLHERVARQHEGEPNAGRHLKFWANQAGFDYKCITSSAGIWCFSSEQERHSWGSAWADRISMPGFLQKAEAVGVTASDVHHQAEAWRKWVANEAAWFAVPHGEVVCRVLK